MSDILNSDGKSLGRCQEEQVGDKSAEEEELKKGANERGELRSNRMMLEPLERSFKKPILRKFISDTHKRNMDLEA